MKPTKNKVYCRECGRTKMLFEEERQALNFLKFNSSEFDDKTPIRACYCDACFGWHLTSREGESYKNPLTDNVLNDYANSRNTSKRLSGFYSADVTACYNNLRSLCSGTISCKKTMEEIKNRLKQIEEHREKLRPYLSSNDFEVVEKVIEETKIRVAQKHNISVI